MYLNLWYTYSAYNQIKGNDAYNNLLGNISKKVLKIDPKQPTLVFLARGLTQNTCLSWWIRKNNQNLTLKRLIIWTYDLIIMCVIFF